MTPKTGRDNLVPAGFNVQRKYAAKAAHGSRAEEGKMVLPYSINVTVTASDTLPDRPESPAALHRQPDRLHSFSVSGKECPPSPVWQILPR